MTTAMEDSERTDRTAICFDLDNTLLSYDRPYEAIVRDGLGAHFEAVTETMTEDVMMALLANLEGLEDDPYQTAANAAFGEGEIAGSGSSEGSSGSGDSGVSPGSGDSEASSDSGDSDVGRNDSVEPRALLETLREEELAATSVSEAARDSLATLSADEDTVLCVLTDGHHDWQREKLAHHEIEATFDHVVTSYDAGGTKLSGAPYEHLRETVAAEEYVMIGDEYEADVEAAREAGFVPIHYEETDGPDFFATLQAML